MWRGREENGNINNKIVKHAVGIEFGQNVQLLSQSQKIIILFSYLKKTTRADAII